VDASSLLFVRAGERYWPEFRRRIFREKRPGQLNLKEDADRRDRAGEVIHISTDTLVVA
jgi:hypothetical protein